jgi:hypothetical protein
MTFLDDVIDRAVQWRRRQRGEPIRWSDDPARVERALTEGIRFTDEELLEMGRAAMLRGVTPPPMSYNEAVRMQELATAAGVWPTAPLSESRRESRHHG